jgi:4-hydroxy-3-methylbut-2-enyl diphosphate reductase
VFVDELDGVPDGATVVFSAHGVSPAVRAEAAGRGLETIDATGPLVTKVHAEARRFAARGDTVVLIGHAGHEEIDGTLGEAPDQTILVQSVDDVAELAVADPTRVSYLTQTTLAVDETTEIIQALRARFPALRGPASSTRCRQSLINRIWCWWSARGIPPTPFGWWNSRSATAYRAISSTIPLTSARNG